VLLLVELIYSQIFDTFEHFVLLFVELIFADI
jgi:hypothetical protein